MTHRLVRSLKTGAMALAFVGATGLMVPVYADGGDSGGGSSGGGGGSSSGSSSGGGIVCRDGWKYNPQKQVCEKQQSELYQRGRAYALAGDYESGLKLLQAIDDKQDSMVLTMIGYSLRKMGRVEEGIATYHQALAIDPDNIHTREYLGEGYVATGRADLAQVQLDKIEAVCGSGCEQYVKLAAVMADETNW